MNRREFFKKIKQPNKSETESRVNNTSKTGVKKKERNISRSKFLETAAIGLASVYFSKDLLKNKKENDIVKKEEVVEKSYQETANQQLLMMTAKYLTNIVLDKLDIAHGNRSITEGEKLNLLKNKPIETLIKSSVFRPILEEWLFRLYPSKELLKNDDSKRWDIGIPISAIFASVHNIRIESGKNSKEDENLIEKIFNSKIKFEKSIPLSQFMGGLFYWHLMRERGYDHAVLAHSINNAIPVSIGAALFKLLPEEKAKKAFKLVDP